MTNSEKQIKGKKAGKASSSSSSSRSSSAASTKPTAPAKAWVVLEKESEKRASRLLFVALLVMGWLFAWHINKWHFTTPVFMLWMGWFGVLLTLRFLWASGAALWVDNSDSEGSFDVSLSRSRELAEEKKSLLRAIKEIEFDRDLGKMSEPDAKEMMRFYRARAIEVIKEIDGLVDVELTVDERIARDIAARMTIAQKTKKRKAKPAATDGMAAESKTPNSKKQSDKRESTSAPGATPVSDDESAKTA